jgi:tryptophan synthase beta chain
MECSRWDQPAISWAVLELRMTESLTRFDLPQSAIPTRWYNIQADLPRPLPPVLHPGTKQPIGPADLAPAVPDGPHHAGGHERSLHRHPGARSWTSTSCGARPRCCARVGWRRPSAPRPGSTTSTRALSPAGQHKLNTAVPQAYYNAKAGIQEAHHRDRRRPVGHRDLAFACQMFGLECSSGMVRVELRPEAVPPAMMEASAHGAPVAPATSPSTAASILEQDPDQPGSLGIAISEAVEAAAQTRRSATPSARSSTTC